MSLIHSKDSAYAVEMRKWEAQHTEFGPPGRPYQYAPYPAMFYRIDQNSNGGFDITDRITVDDENAANNLRSRGYGNGAGEAMQLCLDRQKEIAALAANRAFSDQRMSEKAQREAAAVDAETIEHVPVIPETPIRRKPGRPAKTAE